MNKTVGIQGTRIEKRAREQLKQQIAQYVGQQPESTQNSHKWMKRLEVASLGVILAVFVVALYVSIAWKSVNPILIPIAWFIFAASSGPSMVLIGMHAIILRAFPPIVIPGKSQRFVTGSAAVWPGVGFILMGLALGVFWGYFAYTVGTFNLAMLEPLTSILGVLLGVVITIGILFSLAQKIIKFR